MKNNYIPYCTIAICTITFLYSVAVAFSVTGHLFGTVSIPQLETYGAINFSHLRNLELWRLVASQLIHAKQMHMLYNVLSLAILGMFLEHYLRAIKFFALWFIAGSIGTLISTFEGTPPWNLGTGASQAVLGIAAFGVVLAQKGASPSRWLWAVLAASLIPAFALDFFSAGYPKPGHIAGALIGVIAGIIYLRSSNNRISTPASSTTEIIKDR